MAPFLPGHPLVDLSIGEKAIQPVSSAPYGSALILAISWAYIRLMGGNGLKEATEMALVNANYMKARLESHYKVMYTNDKGLIAHEFILDTRVFDKSANVQVADIAKRLQVLFLTHDRITDSMHQQCRGQCREL